MSPIRRQPLSVIARSTLAVLLIVGCGQMDQTGSDYYARVPDFARAVAITEGTDTLRPVRLQFLQDTLFVSYRDRSQIDLFSPDIEKIRSLILDDPEPVSPTSFFVSDSILFLCDHAKGMVAEYSRDGKLQMSFGLLPDQQSRLSPLSLTFYGGVLYLTDLGLRRVLAISMTDAAGITEKGELILSIPADSTETIGFPSAVHVTVDGRLLIGDAQDGMVHVFTCDGRPIYQFDTVETRLPVGPQSFAVDGVLDSTMMDSTSFDPSGLRSIGRIHIVDGNNSAVHMFSPLGRYIASYPEDVKLSRPSDIAIDTKRARLYVADPQAARILVFKYGD